MQQWKNTKISPAWPARQIAVLENEFTFPSKPYLQGLVCCNGLSQARGYQVPELMLCYVQACACSHSLLIMCSISFSMFLHELTLEDVGERTGVPGQREQGNYFCSRKSLGPITGQKNRLDTHLNVALSVFARMDAVPKYGYLQFWVLKYELLSCTGLASSLLLLLLIHTSCNSWEK